MLAVRNYAFYPIQYLRIGYVRWLYLVDAVVFAVVLIDVCRYLADDLSLGTAWNSLASGGWRTSDCLKAAFWTLTGQLLIIPLFISSARLGLSDSKSIAIWPCHRTTPLVYFHILMAILFAVFSVLAVQMELVSGNAIDFYKNGMHYGRSFTTGFGTFPLLVQYVAIAFSMVVPILGAIWKLISFFDRSAGESLAKQLRIRMSIADLGGELYPPSQFNIPNFNVAASAPTIKFVHARIAHALERYSKHGPGSKDAKENLTSICASATEKLLRIFDPQGTVAHPQVEFYSGTTRALEVVLLGLGGNPLIILSPFEHDTEESAAEWVARIRAGKSVKLSLDLVQVDSSIEQAVEACADEVSRLIGERRSSKASGKVALIVSEIFYLTGERVPVEVLIRVLREKHKLVAKNDYELIIDAAHLLGEMKSLSQFSSVTSIIGSCHKWLMSPEPCGFVIRDGSRVSAIGKSYDVWNSGVPIATGSSMMIAAADSGLELVHFMSCSTIRSLSFQLMRMFIANTKSHVRVWSGRDKLSNDQDDNGSPMCLISPAPGFKWRHSKVPQLEAHFKKVGVSVCICDIVGLAPAVRVSFPYFADLSQLKSLEKAVLRAIVSEGSVAAATSTVV